MTLERRWVDDLGRALFAPLLARASFLGGWRVLGWDAEQGLCLTLSRGEKTLLIELERRDPERECFARTERFNVCARPSFRASRNLDREDVRAALTVVSLVRRRERLLPSVERAPAGRRSIAREIAVDRVLMPEGNRHYYVNPYVGCTIGCAWCYVAERADFSRQLEGLPRLEWGRWVDVKTDAPAILRREVGHYEPGIVRLSPIVTDPYQPIERCFRVTRRCLEVLLEAKFVPCILTRAVRVLEDLPLLRSFERAAVGLSIPTDDDRVRQLFEPGADPIDERIEALARCRAAGLRTFAVVQPVLPGNPRRLAARLAPLVDVVRIDRMHHAESEDRLWAVAGSSRKDSDALAGELARAFAHHGVPLDELDDLSGLLFGSNQCAART